MRRLEAVHPGNLKKVIAILCMCHMQIPGPLIPRTSQICRCRHGTKEVIQCTPRRQATRLLIGAKKCLITLPEGQPIPEPFASQCLSRSTRATSQRRMLTRLGISIQPIAIVILRDRNSSTPMVLTSATRHHGSIKILMSTASPSMDQ